MKLLKLISLSLFLTVANSHCGKSEGTAPEQVPLNTIPHDEIGLSWAGEGIVLTEVGWRLISFDVRADGSSVLRGAYNVEWANNADVTKIASYELRFYDNANFQLDKYDVPDMARIEPHSRRLATGNFELFNISSVEVANSIAEMHVWASFFED